MSDTVHIASMGALVEPTTTMTTIKEAIDEVVFGVAELRTEFDEIKCDVAEFRAAIEDWKISNERDTQTLAQILQILQNMKQNPTESNLMDEDSSTVENSSNPEDSELVSHSVQPTLNSTNESIILPMVDAVDSVEIGNGFQFDIIVPTKLCKFANADLVMDLVLESSSCYLNGDLNFCTIYVRRNANERILYLLSTGKPPPLPPEYIQHLVGCNASMSVAVSTRSLAWSSNCVFGYFYMVAAWDGYVFADEPCIMCYIAMLDAYGNKVDMVGAVLKLDFMADNDIVSWSGVINCFAMNGLSEDGAVLFGKMTRIGLRPPSDFHLVGQIKKQCWIEGVSFWMPQAFPGYVAMGCVASKGAPKEHEFNTLRCIRIDMVTRVLFFEESESCDGVDTVDLNGGNKLVDLLNGTDYIPAYNDKGGEWQLMGDVTWEMFMGASKLMRIKKRKEVIELGLVAVALIAIYPGYISNGQNCGVEIQISEDEIGDTYVHLVADTLIRMESLLEAFVQFILVHLSIARDLTSKMDDTARPTLNPLHHCKTFQLVR